MSYRNSISDLTLHKVLDDIVILHKKRLLQKGDGAFKSSHEILGIISEEFDEMKDAVRKNDIANLREELLDIIVGCIHGICSIDQNELDW